MDNLYKKYVNDNCKEVWEIISDLNYEQLDNNLKNEIDSIILEALKRIEINIKMIFQVLEKNSFQFINYGNLNKLNVPLVVSKNYDNKQILQINELKAPLIFSNFCTNFKVVDFRGDFQNFDRDILLDSLYIDCIEIQENFESTITSIDYKNNSVKGCNFTPDAYIKEDISGDMGCGILMEEIHKIDNYILAFSDEFDFKFIEYLRFCFYWGCFPNLYWAEDAELLPFKNILAEVRNNLLEF